MNLRKGKKAMCFTLTSPVGEELNSAGFHFPCKPNPSLWFRMNDCQSYEWKNPHGVIAHQSTLTWRKANLSEKSKL